MQLGFESFAAWRYLKAGKKKGFISLITLLSMTGITVGVMTLIVVIAVMTGAEHDFRERVLGAQPHILLMRGGNLFYDYRLAMETIQSVDGVIAAKPFVHTQVVLRSSKGLAGAMLKGIDSESFARMGGQIHPAAPLSENAGQDPATYPRIMIGKALAEELGVGPGDQLLYMVFSQGSKFDIGRMPAMRRFRIDGLFSTGLDEYDKAVAFIPLAEAQAIIGSGDAVTGIEVQLRDVENVKAISRKIQSLLKPAYWAMDWMQMNRNIFSALRLQKTVMFIILILIVLVAAFNIAGSLFMMVMERTRDIAILKAMGTNNAGIRRIFIFKGMVIGLIGSLLGVGGGVIICAILSRYHFIDLPGDVYYFTTLPVRLEIPDVLVITSSALLICFLASLYPSFLASRMTPVEGLRIG
ncbi:MAG: lipoprotein-releasing ABC transporter permease subunit [Thermodesulfobacteriota bacterium]